MSAPRVARLLGPVVAVAVVVAALGWLPARRSHGAASDRADAAARLVDDLVWEIEDLGELEPRRSLLETERDALAVAIPDDHDLAGVILLLEAVADQHGFELLDVVPASLLGAFDDADTPVGTSSIVLSVALRGEYRDLVGLLSSLGDQPRLIVVDSLAAAVDELTGLLAVDLEVRVFTTNDLVEADEGFLEDFGDSESPDAEEER